MLVSWPPVAGRHSMSLASPLGYEPKYTSLLTVAHCLWLAPAEHDLEVQTNERSNSSDMVHKNACNVYSLPLSNVNIPVERANQPHIPRQVYP